MAVSDLRTNSAIRSLLAKHWIDIQRLRFSAIRGVVRFKGELRYLGEHSGNRKEASQIETLEREVKRMRDVQRVYFDLKNWRKKEGGEWECLDRATVQTRVEQEDEGSGKVVDIQPAGTENND